MSGVLSAILLFLAGVVIGGMILQVITAKYIFKDDCDNKENYDKGREKNDKSWENIITAI